ncbi:MATE efflux family protein 1 [Hibiscus syriacus]|uniref:Protein DETOXIFICATION n=1 Tax=Hibiscus syriacus TaxID=106335 RepID=A0A6A3CVJ7_HIBSY|nr:MATE efflux family protein 1 [Hibiscus syriacus]
MAVDGVSSVWNNMGKLPLFAFFRDSRHGNSKHWIARNTCFDADPIASLIDTAFIGQMGAVELASVGVSVAIFNQVSRITMFPLVSITTSFVAEEEAASKSSTDIEENAGSDYDADQELVPLTDKVCLASLIISVTFIMFRLICDLSIENINMSFAGNSDIRIPKPEGKRRHVPSATSALIVGCMLGIIQTLFLIFSAKPLLLYMGVKPDSPMLKIAAQYLTLRSLGAPAILLSLSAQGVFRGLKDTKTPLYAIIIGYSTNIILDPILMFTLRLGVNGAAIAHVVSQYLIFLILLWRLVEDVVLLPPNFKDLQFGRFLKSGECFDYENDTEQLQDSDIFDVPTSGFMLLVKVISATSCMTVAASLAARLGLKPMAAFQVCFQIWLATSLLADGLAVPGQAMLASAFAKKDYEKTVSVAARVLQIGVVLGLMLSLILAAVSPFASTLFTNDFDVLELMNISFPFIAVTQPINALAFVFDGVNYGASDFAYSAYSMIVVAIMSLSCLFVLASSNGYVGIWIALTIFMCLRVFAGLFRCKTLIAGDNFGHGDFKTEPGRIPDRKRLSHHLFFSFTKTEA